MSQVGLPAIRESEGGLMPDRYAFYAGLDGLAFSENASWVHMIRPGTWNHPKYGEIEITPDRIRNYARSINERVRGVDPDVDYEHKTTVTFGTKAAGWIKKAEARDDGLWVYVEWTPDGAKAVENGDFRYFSAELISQWCDEESGQCYDDVVLGGAITNRPFIKKLVPLNLSEIIEDNFEFRDFSREERERLAKEGKALPDGSFPIVNKSDLRNAVQAFSRSSDKGKAKSHIIKRARALGATDMLPEEWRMTDEGVNMEEFLKKLHEALGLEGDPSAEAVLAKIEKLTEEPPPDEGDPSKGGGDDPKPNDEARKFAELFPTESKRLAELEITNRRNEAEKFVMGLSEKGLAPAVHDEVLNYRVSLSDDKVPTFDEVITKVIEAGVVALGERGSDSAPDKTDPAARFQAEVKKLMEGDDKLEYADAVRRVTQTNPDLAHEYIEAQRSG